MNESTSAPACWLMKSEPDVYSIDDLARDGITPWTGVRNYQARNFMRDVMKPGDLVFFYHSNAEPSGITGLGRVAGPAYPDVTARDPASEYYDPKATGQNPIWMLVDVEFVEKFARFLSLKELREDPALAGMLVIKRGMRLSVQPVEPDHAVHLLGLGRAADSVHPTRLGGSLALPATSCQRGEAPAEPGTCAVKIR